MVEMGQERTRKDNSRQSTAHEARAKPRPSIPKQTQGDPSGVVDDHDHDHKKVTMPRKSYKCYESYESHQSHKSRQKRNKWGRNGGVKDRKKGEEGEGYKDKNKTSPSQH